MRSTRSHLAPALLAVTLAACGGSDSDDAQKWIDRADAKEAEARAAGVASPCADVSQCAVLGFLDPRASCSTWTYKPYSLVSSTAAAASAAAHEQNALAAEALMRQSDGHTVCPASVATPPALTCVANACGP